MLILNLELPFGKNGDDFNDKNAEGKDDEPVRLVNKVFVYVLSMAMLSNSGF